MENKRLELVPRDSSDEHNVAECKEISHRDKMCSCEDDVAEKTNTSEGDGACRSRVLSPKEEYVKILDFTHFSRVFRFSKTGDYGREKEIFHEIKVSVVMELV